MNAPALIGDNRPALVTVDSLKADFAYFGPTITALEKRGADAPPVVEDDEDLGIIKALSADLVEERKRIEGIGAAESKPYYDAHKTAVAFFKALAIRLTVLQEAIELRGTRYLEKKAAAARARQHEIERQQREESERKAREAVEAAKAGDRVKATIATEQSRAAENRANESAAAQSAKPSELARTQTAAGTATLVERWDFEIVAFASVDLEALRPYLLAADVEKAIRKFVAIHKGTRPLPGVRVFTNNKMR